MDSIFLKYIYTQRWKFYRQQSDQYVNPPTSRRKKKHIRQRRAKSRKSWQRIALKSEEAERVASSAAAAAAAVVIISGKRDYTRRDVVAWHSSPIALLKSRMRGVFGFLCVTSGKLLLELYFTELCWESCFFFWIVSQFFLWIVVISKKNKISVSVKEAKVDTV